MQKTDHHTTVEGHEGALINSLRPLLTTYAYNITGSLEDARDLVQDAYLQYMQSGTVVTNPKAYLVRIVINLSINRNTQRKKVAYPGEWLPEPVMTELPDSSLLAKDVLEYSLMVLLEQLNAKERAVFILREAFHYEYPEIAAALDISEANARQLLSRAKKQLQQRKPAAPPDPKAFLLKYLDVIRKGDTTRLEELLHQDIVAVSDGGGKASAAVQSLAGRKAVLAYVFGIFRKFYQSADVRPTLINHQPALLYYHNGQLSNCQVFTIDATGASQVYFIRNPDKLRLPDV